MGRFETSTVAINADHSSSANKSAVCGRWYGALASARITHASSAGDTSMPGHACIIGGGSWLSCICMYAAGESAWNGGRPVSISYSSSASE